MSRPGPSLDPDVVRRAADLARLDVAPEELPVLAADFARILAAFGTLAAAEVDGVAPLVHPVEIATGLRPDRLEPGVERCLLLRGAPDARDGFYAVPKTIGGAG